MRQNTRQRLLVTTSKLLQRQGFHGTGLNQIVADAGAPKGSMYFHFPGGKEQLAAEALELSASGVDEALERHGAMTALEALDSYLVDVAALLQRTEFREGCPIATVALEVGATSADIGNACAAAFDRLIQRVAGWIESDGVEPAIARDRAFTIYAAIEGALMFAKAKRSIEPITRLRAQLTQLLGTRQRSARSG